MKTIIVCFLVPLSVSIAASVVQPNVAVAGKFSEKCRDEKVEDKSEPGKVKVVISASCEDELGINNPNAEVVISDFIANHEGKLAWDSKGGLRDCKDFNLKPEEKTDQYTPPTSASPMGFPRDSFPSDHPYKYQRMTLFAKCKDGKGEYQDTNLLIDDKLTSHRTGNLVVEF